MDKRFNDIRSKFNNKLLNTRKRRFSFIKLCVIRKYNIYIDVRRIKEIMYGEVEPKLDYEIDALSLFNLYSELLETKSIDIFSNIIKIDNITLDIDNIINTIYSLYGRIDLVYLFMIMNYLFLCNNLSIINPYKRRYDDFIRCLEEHSEKRFYELIIDVLDNIETLDIDYYDKCLETNKGLIINFINDNKDIIKEEGRINNIYLFGSYAFGKIRYDSDIDLLVITKDDQTYEAKVEGVIFIKNLIEERFKRIVDIHETTKDLLEKDSNVFKGAILIF